MADSNKIKYGISNCYYAVASIATNGTASYSTPVAIPGAVNLSLSAQGDNNVFYADNIAYFTTFANNGYEGDLEIAKIPDSFYKDVLGFIEDGEGALVEDAGAVGAHFALIGQFEGDAHAKRFVLYNCVASRPEMSGSTKTETIEPQTETISITATSVYNTVLDANVVKASLSESTTGAYTSWLTSVYQTVTT